MVPPHRCVVLVPTAGPIAPECEDGLDRLERRGYPVRRVRGYSAIDAARNQMASDALADGFDELFWIDADVGFDPADVDTLRRRGRPFLCGLYPKKGPRAFACAFLPGTRSVAFGRAGGPTPVRYAGLGFAYTRREVYERVRDDLKIPACNQRAGRPVTPYFAPFAVPDGDGLWYLAEDYAFCERARRCGYEVTADTTVRLWHVGAYRYGWEDAGGALERYASYTFHLPTPVVSDPPADPPPADSPPAGPPPAAPVTGPPPRPTLRGVAGPLPPGFPRFGAYVVTYPANADALGPTLAGFRDSDWGADPAVFVQPADWPTGKESASRTYRLALERAAADGCDFALVLEDDVRVGRHLRHNLRTCPLVARDQCDYLSLFVPDLIADPWDRSEPHLGYRLARPRYSGPNRTWEKYRLWGSQAYLLSRRFVLAALDRWDRLTEGQDTRVLSVCSELAVPPWYSAPCLVEHAPARSAFGTPTAYAPDFDPDFRLAVGPGFQPPEAVPGWLSEAEGKLLWEVAEGRAVLELGTAAGRSAVCLGQSARRVVSVDVGDQSEAAEWSRRYGLADRVTFRRGDVADVCGAVAGERFGLAFIDTEHDAASVTRDIGAALPLLEPGGLVAFHDYPDPGWPDVRRVVDDHARRLGWKRIAQSGYVGVFRTPPIPNG